MNWGLLQLRAGSRKLKDWLCTGLPTGGLGIQTRCQRGLQNGSQEQVSAGLLTGDQEQVSYCLPTGDKELKSARPPNGDRQLKSAGPLTEAQTRLMATPWHWAVESLWRWAAERTDVNRNQTSFQRACQKVVPKAEN